MLPNRLPFAALAVACICAAGVGGYFATRQNTVPTPAAASESPVPASAASARPVQETEAIVGDTAKAPAAAAQSAPAPAGNGSPAKTASRADVRRSSATPDSKFASARTRQDPLVLDRTSVVPPASTPAVIDNSTPPHVDEPVVQEPPRAPEPPQKILEELVVTANSVIGLQIDRAISSETARVEDRVEARVTRDVKVSDKIAVPAGSRAIGSVIQVERGGKYKERARLGIRFTTLALADGTRLPISTEAIYRDGEAPGNASAAKIGGGAVGGAILGAILGGAKGAAIGATAGAGGGAAVVQSGDRNAVTLPAGSPLTVRLLTPVTVTIEQK